MLVDSHCHLDFPEFKENLDLFIAEALANNVEVLQTICTKISELSEIENIIAKYKNIFGSVGIHPCEVANEKEVSVAEIVAYTKNPKIIGIGETGLDFYYSSENKEAQIRSFIKHINAAQETGLPVIIHTRDAEEETIKILEEQMQIKPFKALIHCFTASQKFAEACLRLGIYISVSGIITFKNATAIREALNVVPLDMLLIETDSPYLAPSPMRGQKNQPSYVKYVAQHLALIKGVEYSEIANVTTANFFRLFNKAII